MNACLENTVFKRVGDCDIIHLEVVDVVVRSSDGAGASAVRKKFSRAF